MKAIIGHELDGNTETHGAQRSDGTWIPINFP